MEKKSNCCCRQAQCSGEKHDWCERTTVKCGAFHQCADGLEVFFGPFRFHMFTLQSKAKSSKRKGCFGTTLRKGAPVADVGTRLGLSEIPLYRRKEILDRLQHSFGKTLIQKISFRIG